MPARIPGGTPPPPPLIFVGKTACTLATVVERGKEALPSSELFLTVFDSFGLEKEEEKGLFGSPTKEQ